MIPPVHSEPIKPAPLLTTLLYVTGLAVMVFAMGKVSKECHFPGNDFATLTVPALLAIGVAGTTILSMGFAILGYLRGEPKALRALWLVPVLALVTAFLGGLAGLSGIL